MALWIDDDFPRLTLPDASGTVVLTSDLAEGLSVGLYRPQARYTLVNEPSGEAVRDALLIHGIERTLQWLQDLGVAVNGYDQNVLRRWLEAGAVTPMPQLSRQINEPYRGNEEERKALAEAAGYSSWLKDAQKRQEREAEAELLRQYPISYPAWQRQMEWEEQKRREKERREAEEWARVAAQKAQLEAAERRKREEQERELREHQQGIRLKMLDVLRGGGSLNDVSPGEYVEWLETLASDEELEELDARLKEEARWLGLPEWRKRLEEWWRS